MKTKKLTFKVGDRVVALGDYGGLVIKGRFGTVRTLKSARAGVEFDEKLPEEYGHNLRGAITSVRGWYMPIKLLRHAPFECGEAEHLADMVMEEARRDPDK